MPRGPELSLPRGGPLTAAAEYQYRIRHARDTWDAGVECEVRITADGDNFYVEGEY